MRLKANPSDFEYPSRPVLRGTNIRRELVLEGYTHTIRYDTTEKTVLLWFNYVLYSFFG